MVFSIPVYYSNRILCALGACLLYGEYTALCSNSTVDRENFAVKIISRSWPTAKIKHAKKNLRGDDQWIGARKSTPPKVNVKMTTIYSQQYLGLLIPGSTIE